MAYPTTFPSDHSAGDPNHVNLHNSYEEILNALQAFVPTAPILKAVGTAKGDLLVFQANGTVIRLAVGPNGKILVADSASTGGVKWDDALALSTADAASLAAVADSGSSDDAAPIDHVHSFFGASMCPPVIVPTGTYLMVSGTTSTSTANAYTAGKMFLSPIDVAPASQTFDRIASNITVVGTGSGQVIRMGIYANDATGKPTGAPILDAGTITSLSGTGDKAITISQSLSHGRYWLAWALQGTVSGSPTVVTTSCMNQMGVSSLANSTFRVWAQSGVTAALPTIGTLFLDTNPPHVGLRAA